MKKFLSILALLLCLAMLFAACDKSNANSGDDDRDDDSEQTTASEENYDAASDIDALVKQWNSSTNQEVAFDKTIELLLSTVDKYQVVVSDLKADDEVLVNELIINSKEFYVDVEDWDTYGCFKLEDGILNLLTVGFDESSSHSFFERYDLNGYIDGYNGVEVKIPEITADDIKDEGGRTYSIKREYVDKFFDYIVDNILDSMQVESSEKREVKALINGYLEDIVFEAKYKMGNSGVAETNVKLEVPEELYLDIVDSALDDEMLEAIKSTEYDYSCAISVSSSLDGDMLSKFSIDADIYIPMNAYLEGDVLEAEILMADLELTFNADKLLSSDDEKLTLNGKVGVLYNAYKKSGESYKFDKELTDELARSTEIAADASLVGEKFEAKLDVVNSEGEWDENYNLTYTQNTVSATLSCNISFGKKKSPTLNNEVKKDVEKFNTLIENYEEASEEAVAAVTTALSNVKADADSYIYEYATFYNEELDVYFDVEMFIDGESRDDEISVYGASFNDIYNTYYVKKNASGVYTLYDYENNPVTFIE